jgi:hypothetical protein
VSGETKNDSKIKDDTFNIEAKDSVKLIRTVEMYQWHEKRERRNKRTVISYYMDWNERVINSNGFSEPNHMNPASMPYESLTVVAPKITLGGYTLADSQKAKLNNQKPIKLSSDEVEDIQKRTSAYLKDNQYEALKPSGEALFAKLSRNGEGTQVGDLRITFHHVPTGPTTIIAQQT